MCANMVDPAVGILEIEEIPTMLEWTTMGPQKGLLQDIFSYQQDCVCNVLAPTSPPKCIVDDNGSKFKLDFTVICDLFGVKYKPTIIKNSQVNVSIKRFHRVVSNIFLTTDY